ncbi:MAG: glycosyltransferase family 39 protein, partial [Phycisphaerales bacterium]|nr:glycosyltransferase family 39 protein [Phycisphaerales bacterium]
MVDRDEARFAQASRQMFEAVALDHPEPHLHDGGLLIPKVQDRWRLNKPPLIYWLQAGAASMCTLGDPLADAIWMYRLPSLAAFLVTVLATWSLGRRLYPGAVGLYAGLMIALAPVFMWEAHQARADQVMIACTTLAMRSLWIAFDTGRRREALTAAIFVALGVLTKGPVTPMIVLLAIAFVATVTRSGIIVRRAHLVVGSVIVLAAIFAWMVPVAMRIGTRTYVDLILDETVGRSMDAKEGHWGPPGYHLVLLVILFWPGVLLTGLAIRRALRLARNGAWRRPWTGRAPETFLLGWILPSWIVFELVSTKLPHYTMPLYPPLAILSARALFAGPRLIGLDERLSRIGFRAWALPAVVLLTLAPSLLYGALRMDQPLVVIPMVPVSVFGLLVMFVMWKQIERGSFIWATRLAFVCSGLAGALIFGVLFPRAESLWITRQ